MGGGSVIGIVGLLLALGAGVILAIVFLVALTRAMKRDKDEGPPK